jgi:hypothetical protein
VKVRKGFRKTTRFLSHIQLLKVWDQVCQAGGSMHLRDIIHNDITIGRWFTPAELSAAVLRHMDDEVKRLRHPRLIVEDSVVYNNWPVEDFPGAFKRVVKGRVKKYATYLQPDIIDAFDLESEGGEEREEE